MTKRYAVYPGPVRSKNDGALHFINYQRLVRLYRVSIDECVNMSDPRSFRGVDVGRLIALVPKRSGNYTEDTAPPEAVRYEEVNP